MLKKYLSSYLILSAFWAYFTLMGVYMGVCVFAWTMAFGKADLYLHHQGPGPITVLVDGEQVETMNGAGVTHLKLAQGNRRLEVQGTHNETWDINDVDGFGKYLFSTDPETCFVVVDVGNTLYSDEDACNRLDRACIICTYDPIPTQNISSPSFAIDELPQERSQRRVVTRTVAGPCKNIRRVAAAEALGAFLKCPST